MPARPFPQHPHPLPRSPSRSPPRIPEGILYCNRYKQISSDLKDGSPRTSTPTIFGVAQCFFANAGSESLKVHHIGATILHPNTKVFDFQGLFVFLGVKNTPLSPVHLFLNLMDLNLQLQPRVEKIKPLIYCINE